MTEFEMASLMTDMQAGLMMSTATLFTIVSAFLVAGYAAGGQLNRLTAAIVVAIFAWAFLMTTFTINRQIANVNGLIGEMSSYAATGAGLEWHAAARPMIMRPLLVNGALFNAFAAIIFVVAVIFFIHCRRTKRS